EESRKFRGIAEQREPTALELRGACLAGSQARRDALARVEDLAGEAALPAGEPLAASFGARGSSGAALLLALLLAALLLLGLGLDRLATRAIACPRHPLPPVRESRVT